MAFISFDIETRLEAEGFEPLIAATCERVGDELRTTFYSALGIHRPLNRLLSDLCRPNVTVTAWNGAAFDCRYMAQRPGVSSLEASGWKRLAASLHDPFAMVFARKGFGPGLDSVAKKMLGEFGGKVHSVRLNDGSLMNDMGGLHAARLWDAGEYSAVSEYLRGDVEQNLLVVEEIERKRCVEWVSKSGRENSVYLGFSLDATVPRLRMLREPDVSWMEKPLTREGLWGWMDV